MVNGKDVRVVGVGGDVTDKIVGQMRSCGMPIMISFHIVPWVEQFI